jgi:hypothetical protein
MELIPSEQAVLRQVRDMFVEASVRTHRFTVLSSRWPAAHYEAFRAGFDGRVKKGLLTKTQDERLFCITAAGLKAMA